MVFEAKRQAMVRDQIAARGVSDPRVLAAMGKVPRHLFVPVGIRHLAYEDYPLPIGDGQTISQPYIVALMTEALALKGNERALEIGTGSGYQAAVLAEICHEVYTMEILEPLSQRAESTLTALGYDNVRVKHGDGYQGWPEQAPFGAVIITCASPRVPQPLLDQLAQEGRLIVPLGPEGGTQVLTLFTKRGNKIEQRFIAEVRFVPMTGEGAKH
ncbi:MAG: protein-L-isoaspartate(D-aspartate) O-methyltransferase [Candidatus Edwardsbacteria bacterium]|nr:protein-L-isoaspartate(D-aspartate) O-methyltransferase [Candidatus Edwardsbacteria bacterium]